MIQTTTASAALVTIVIGSSCIVALESIVTQKTIAIVTMGAAHRFFQTATLARFVRAEIIENLPLDYVRTARAKGLRSNAVIIRHVVRNSLIPVVTLIALGVQITLASFFSSILGMRRP